MESLVGIRGPKTRWRVHAVPAALMEMTLARNSAILVDGGPGRPQWV